jgi:hypothetical protein
VESGKRKGAADMAGGAPRTRSVRDDRGASEPPLPFESDHAAQAGRMFGDEHTVLDF